MGLAFGSVGVTEWARRRGDRVIEMTLKQTALYLPLIPMIGFWLTGGFIELGNTGQDVVGQGLLAQRDWTYVGGKVRYDGLLGIGAVYYLAISAIWKTAAPRITAVVLANAALWVLLIQQPGWGFLASPNLVDPASGLRVDCHPSLSRSFGPGGDVCDPIRGHPRGLHQQYGGHVVVPNRHIDLGPHRVDHVGTRGNGRGRGAKGRTVPLLGGSFRISGCRQHGASRATIDRRRLAVVGVWDHDRDLAARWADATGEE